MTATYSNGRLLLTATGLAETQRLFELHRQLRADGVSAAEMTEGWWQDEAQKTVGN